MIFRPSPALLPSTSNGDVLILRNFKVKMRSRKLCLQSQKESAWATVTMSQGEVKLHIPHIPVEYSEPELMHSLRLYLWWQSSGLRLTGRISSPEL